MKDFDSDWSARRSKDNRSFRLCGETFVARRAVPPEEFMNAGPDADTPPDQQWAKLDELVLTLIEHDDDAEARYRKIRASEDGLSIADIREVIDWLIEQQTGRPPTSQNASPGGGGPTATPSRGRSSLRAVSGSPA